MKKLLYSSQSVCEYNYSDFFVCLWCDTVFTCSRTHGMFQLVFKDMLLYLDISVYSIIAS